MEFNIDNIVELMGSTAAQEGSSETQNEDTTKTEVEEETSVKQENTSNKLYAKFKAADENFEIEESLLNEGDDSIVKAWNEHVKAKAIAEYEKDLPLQARAIAEAYKKAGGDVDQYPSYINELEILENSDLSKLSPEDKATLYNKLSTEQDADVKDASLAALIEKGKLDDALTGLVENTKTTLKNTIKKIEDDWNNSLEEASEKFKTFTKKEEDILKETEELYGVKLNDAEKEEMQKLFKTSADPKSTKDNLKPTNEFIKVLSDPNTRVKLAYLITQGYFKPDSKINLAAQPNAQSQDENTDNVEPKEEEVDVVDIINNL